MPCDCHYCDNEEFYVPVLIHYVNADSKNSALLTKALLGSSLEEELYSGKY